MSDFNQHPLTFKSWLAWVAGMIVSGSLLHLVPDGGPIWNELERKAARLLAHTTTPSLRPKAPPKTTKAADLQHHVCNVDTSSDGYLALRQGPGVAYGELTRMPENTGFHVIKRQGNWVNLVLPDSTTGWAYGRWVCRG